MGPEAIALLASLSFALFAVYGWMGLTHSTPLTATIVSLAARTITLGAAVVFTGGIPNFAYLALAVFVFLGVLQSATSLLTFIGLQKIGTSRSQPLRNSYPLWSAGLAIAVMHEQASLAVLAGTLSVVIGVVLISWKPETALPNYRWWHVLYSLAAGFLAGVAFPLRRYGLTITNEPVFFSFVVAVMSLLGHPMESFGSGSGLAPEGSLAFFLVGVFRGLGSLIDVDRAHHRPGRHRFADCGNDTAF